MVNVENAVYNNIIWCGMVCESHGVTQTSREGIWGLHSKAPEFYPDIITSSKQIMSEQVMDFIGNREVTGIKDSFSTLNMTPWGFRILFEAKWIYHKPVFNATLDETEWKAISSADEFAQWTAASELQNVIKPNLLERKDVKIFMKESKGELSGFIANLGANVVGVSNVFSNSKQKIWPDIVSVVSVYFPGIPLVGYESGDDLNAALSSGWTALGPLRVWIK